MGLEAIKSYGNVSVQQTQNNISLQQSGQGSAEHVAGSVHTSSGMDNTYTAQNAQQVKQNTQPAQPTVEENFTTEEKNIAKSLDEVEQENQKIRSAVAEMSKKMTSNTEAVFGIHEATNTVTIKIVDRDSKKVIKEIPPEKTLDMIAKVWELAGIMVDEKR
jgi:flagellar protein FlaG